MVTERELVNALAGLASATAGEVRAELEQGAAEEPAQNAAFDQVLMGELVGALQNSRAVPPPPPPPKVGA